MDSSKTKVFAIESNAFKRHIREAVAIRLRNPSLNRDNGFELGPFHTYVDIFESATFYFWIQKFPRPHVRIKIEFACSHASDGIRIHLT